MKFSLPTKQQKLDRELETYKKWHRKFAWKPTRMTRAPEVVIWLEFMLRRGEARQYSPKVVWHWEYVESTFDVLKMGR